jgi:putative nucleotidyltransferase with HDIG domain
MAADPRYRLLKQISRVLRGRSLYPTGHPQLKEAVTELTQSLPGLFDGRPEIRIVVSDDRLFVDDVRNAEMEMVAHDFKAKLKAQGVELVVLTPGLTGEEILAFTEGLLTGHASGLPHIQMGKLNMGPSGPRQEAAGPRHDFGNEVHLLREVFEGWDQIEGLVTDHVERIMRVIEENLFADLSSFMPLAALKTYDEYTFTHAINIAILTMAQAESLGVPKRLVHDFGVAALLHDIGKTTVPEHILKKAGKLEPHEFEEMKKHPINGSIMLLKNPEVPKLAAIVAYEHHLQYDLSGYPALPQKRPQHLCSMLTSLSDFYDALRTNRPYHDAKPSEDILAMLEARIGVNYEERLARHFMALIRARTAA